MPALTITVNNFHDTPTISGAPAATSLEDSLYSFTPTVSDEDSGDLSAMSVSAINLPSWLSLDSNTGAISGTPNNSDVGLYNNIQLQVTDPGGKSAHLPAFSIIVMNSKI